ncbi:conjugal transfer protein [Enterococcus faecalis]|uniref:conjugal transfer protein n=1 Tax=Enterococcus faecalis TaxID=1351 RepID=UPI00325A97B1
MKFEIKRATKIKKEQKAKTIHVGLKRKSTVFLWGLLLASLSFGVYKNFTAIDTHTIKEKEVIQLTLVDTTKIQSFVENFVKTYYSWQRTSEALEKRNKELEKYLTPALQELNKEMIRADIPTTATVRDVQFWEIEQVSKETYTVLFSVEQGITENKKTTNLTSAYKLTIHVEKNGDMVIIENPTLTSKPEKSKYEQKQLENDGTIDSKTNEEITTFLETFFRLYPKASQKELDYYVSNQSLKPIEKEYVFSELIQPIYQKEDKKVKVAVSVKYLDKETKAIQISQFQLLLEKQGNWIIVQ